MYERRIYLLKLSKSKIECILARKRMTTSDIAKEYGVSRSRINYILRKENITPICAGKLAAALNVDVTEIIETN